MKTLKWKPNRGLISICGDLVATDPYREDYSYSVYKGATSGTFYWYRNVFNGVPETHECFSIKNGCLLAEIEFMERYINEST